MPHTATTNRHLEARAAVPKRNLTLRDEFGPHRGRPFTLAATAPARAPRELDDLGRPISRRSTLAYEVAC